MPDAPTAGLDPQKKRLIASEQDPGRRQLWWEMIREIAPERLVFVDESGANIAMTPRYGRAPRGQPCRGRVPRNWGKNTTLLAALTQQGITAALMVESAVDRLIFEAFVARVLAPTLRPGQIVIWDNLSAHHSELVEQVLTACGCELIWLPPYSPDLTPIEQAFAKIKSALRRANARTRDELWDAIGAAIASVTSTDAVGWFTHCGYYTTPHYFWNWV